MANFIEKLLTSFFGSKNDRELKGMESRVADINAEYEKLKSLSNDELRNKTNEFKVRIKEFLAEIDGRISEIINRQKRMKICKLKKRFIKK